MKERGKAVEAYNGGGNNFSDYGYYSATDLPCKKHPSSSSVGICAYCLKDRLVKLVCSDCGEQRLSSCSCTDQISFLIENEKTETPPPMESHLKAVGERSDAAVLLKRSSSNFGVAMRSSGFWRIGKFFRKKREKERLGVSRSRSLCSLRGGGSGFNDADEGNDFTFSSAKISNVTCSFLLDSDKQCEIGESETRNSGFKSGFDGENGFDFMKAGILELDGAAHRSAFALKESDFNAMDESGFIDLKLDLSSDSRTDDSFLNKLGEVSDHGGGSVGRSLRGDGAFGSGGSCRITVSDIGIKREAKGRRVWKWIFSHQPGSKKDENTSSNPNLEKQ